MRAFNGHSEVSGVIAGPTILIDDFSVSFVKVKAKMAPKPKVFFSYFQLAASEAGKLRDKQNKMYHVTQQDKKQSPLTRYVGGT